MKCKGQLATVGGGWVGKVSVYELEEGKPCVHVVQGGEINQGSECTPGGPLNEPLVSVVWRL